MKSNLPPGCTNRMIDIAMGGGSPCAICKRVCDDLINELDHPTNNFSVKIKSLVNGQSIETDEWVCNDCGVQLLKEILETL